MNTPKNTGSFLPMIQAIENKAVNDTLNDLLVFLLQNEKQGRISSKTIIKDFIKPKQQQIKTNKP